MRPNPRWGDHGVARRDGDGIVDHDDPVARARCVRSGFSMGAWWILNGSGVLI
jgi:hypothetical protein